MALNLSHRLFFVINGQPESGCGQAGRRGAQSDARSRRKGDAAELTTDLAE